MSWWRRLIGPPAEAPPSQETEAEEMARANRDACAIFSQLLRDYRPSVAMSIISTLLAVGLKIAIEAGEKELARAFWQHVWKVAGGEEPDAIMPAASPGTEKPQPVVSPAAPNISTFVWDINWEKRRH